MYLACTCCSAIADAPFNRKISEEKNIQMDRPTTVSSVFKIQTICFLCVNRLWTPSATLNAVNLASPWVWNSRHTVGPRHHRRSSDCFPRSDDGVSRLGCAFSPHCFVGQASGTRARSWVCSPWPTWRLRLALISTMSFLAGPAHPHCMQPTLHRKCLSTQSAHQNPKEH